MPNFWLATLVVVFPSLWWGWSPPIKFISFTEDPLGNLGQFIMPSIVLGMLMSGMIMRMTRTMMLEVLRQDYKDSLVKGTQGEDGHPPACSSKRPNSGGHCNRIYVTLGDWGFNYHREDIRLTRPGLFNDTGHGR